MLPVSLPASWPLQTLPTQEPRGGWKSLVREGFLATYLPAKLPVTRGVTSDDLSRVPQSSTWPSPALPLTWPPAPVSWFVMAQATASVLTAPPPGTFSCLCLGVGLPVSCVSYFVFSVPHSFLVLLGGYFPSLIFSLELAPV